jgi:hypothetical protein
MPGATLPRETRQSLPGPIPPWVFGETVAWLAAMLKEFCTRFVKRSYDVVANRVDD